MRRGEQVLFGLLVAAVLCAYGWLSVVGSKTWHFGEPQKDHYNLLVAGFLKGQLSLDAPVHPDLLKLPDPYDPAQRIGIPAIHDATLYKGRYYIYYGPAPAIALLLPYRLLTGQMLPLGAALTVFCGAGFACSLLLLFWVWRDFFPKASLVSTAFAGLSLGFVSFAPVLVRRHAMYEFAIAGGYLFSFAALLFLYRALRSAVWRRTNLALASFLLGLAVCARPVYLFVPAILVLALWQFWREEGKAKPWSTGSRLPGMAAAVVLPLGLVFGLMALYNYLRFGSVSEFGVTYILSGVQESKVPHFGLNYVPYNAQAYLFHLPELDRYFPFIHTRPIATPVPPFHFGTDALCGVLPLAPVVLAGLGLLVWRSPRNSGGGGAPGFALRLFFPSVLWSGASVLAFLLCFCAAMARYAGDFMPAFALLAACGFLAVENALALRFGGLPARLFAAFGSLAFLASAMIGLLAGLLTLDGFAVASPSAYASTARFFNRRVAAIERFLGAEPGALVFSVTSPEAAPKREEELLRAFSDREIEKLLVSYPAPDRVRLGLSLAGASVLWSEPLSCAPGSRHTLRLQTGELLPPSSHPFYESLDDTRREDLLYTNIVSWDGAPVLFDWRRSFSSRAGVWQETRKGESCFSGKLERLPREGFATVSFAEAPFRMVLRFPAGLSPDERALEGSLLPKGVERLSLVSHDASILWRLREQDGTTWEATTPSPPERTVLADLTRLQTGAASVWLLSLEGSAHEFRKVPSSPASTQLPSAEELVVAAAPQSLWSFPPDARSVRLKLRFPKAPVPGVREPLLVAGETGRGDFLFVEYLEGNRFRFGWDHWGVPARWSEPSDFLPGESGDFELEAPGWGGDPRAGELRLPLSLWWRGRLLWRETVRCYPVFSDRFYPGYNPIGGSSCGRSFSGRLR